LGLQTKSGRRKIKKEKREAPGKFSKPKKKASLLADMAGRSTGELWIAELRREGGFSCSIKTPFNRNRGKKRTKKSGHVSDKVKRGNKS